MLQYVRLPFVWRINSQPARQPGIATDGNRSAFRTPLFWRGDRPPGMTLAAFSTLELIMIFSR
ncbi:hypothetical protein [Chimaeribacter californicus]|uniref:hypothetical protein n=1 Tax=Chimaeribacter californicus TaxID=2060067 RepID=UPI0013FCFD1B|nr:hypothetical protein [Chimaeribacter californicus]